MTCELREPFLACGVVKPPYWKRDLHVDQWKHVARLDE
jgi:hypothetical protein